MKGLTYKQKRALAEIGHPHHLDKLVNDPHWCVRSEAEYQKRERPMNSIES